MHTVAAVLARNCATEMVRVFYLLTIFRLLLELKLGEIRGSPITFMAVAGSSIVVPQTTVNRLGAALPLEGGGVSCTFLNCPPGRLSGLVLG